MNNPNTLLVKFYGFYMVQPRGQGKEMYFIVMENAFPADMKIDERYDLKVTCYLYSDWGHFGDDNELLFI